MSLSLVLVMLFCFLAGFQFALQNWGWVAFNLVAVGVYLCGHFHYLSVKDTT